MTLARSVAHTAYLTALLALFLFVASLLGTQLFAYRMAFCDAVQGSSRMCPGGDPRDCPAHYDCYVPVRAGSVWCGNFGCGVRNALRRY